MVCRVQEAWLLLILVGTAITACGMEKQADYSFIEQASKNIAKYDTDREYYNAAKLFYKVYMRVEGDVSCWNSNNLTHRNFVNQAVAQALLPQCHHLREYLPEVKEKALKDAYDELIQEKNGQELPGPEWVPVYCAYLLKLTKHTDRETFKHSDTWPELRKSSYDTYRQRELSKLQKLEKN